VGVPSGLRSLTGAWYNLVVADTRDIRISVGIRARPARVYEALTSARELCQWWLERAETDARNLGRVRMVWPPACGGGEVQGVFVDLEPGSKVAWLWGKPSKSPKAPPLVSCFIERRGRGCEVTIVQAGFPPAGARADRYDAFHDGWEDCLAKLKLYLETGRGAKSEKLKLQETRA